MRGMVLIRCGKREKRRDIGGVEIHPDEDGCWK